MKKKVGFSILLLMFFVVIFVYASSPSYTVNAPANGTYINGANDGNYTINVTTSVSSNITVSIMNASNGLNISHFTSNLNTTHIFIWNTTNGTFPEGTYNITVVGFNQTNASEANSIVNAANNITIDTTNASISNIEAQSVTDTSATITWSLSEDGNATVNYGTSLEIIPTTNNGTSTTYALSPSVVLNGLSGDTTYYVNVTSCDRAGNCNKSGPINFTTMSPPPSGDSSSSGSSNNDVEVFSVEEEFVQSETTYVGDRFNFEVSGSDHSVKLTSVDYDLKQVVLTVSSDPQEFMVSEGESIVVDANADGTDDLRVTVVDILSAAKAIIKYEGIVVVDEPVKDEPNVKDLVVAEEPLQAPETSDEGINYTFWWVLLGIVILALLVYFINKNRK